MLGSKLIQTVAQVSQSGTAKAGTVTMVGGNVRGAGKACTGAETKEIEKGKSEGEKRKRG